MRELVSYLWAQSFFENAGRAGAGRHVFVAKQCAICHEDALRAHPRLPVQDAWSRPLPSWLHSGITALE